MSEIEDVTSTWVTVAEAASALGVSERAVQKRAAAGKIAARRRETPQGVRWEIAANALARTSEPREPNAPEVRELAPERTAEPVHEPQPEVPEAGPNLRTEPDANERTARTEPRERTNEPPNFAPEFVAHLMEENKFLRGALEARDRDAAELRAALREALKISTRALPTATQNDAKSSEPQVLAASPPAAQGATQSDAQAEEAQVLEAAASEPPRTPPPPPPQTQLEVSASTWERRRGLRAWLLNLLRG